VESFAINQNTLPPLATDSIRWDVMVMAGRGFTEIKMMNDKRSHYGFKFDSLAHTLKFQTEDTLIHMDFDFKRIDSTHIALSGKQDNDSIFVLLKKMEFELEKHQMKIINNDRY
jgi:hypothetical protein